MTYIVIDVKDIPNNFAFFYVWYIYEILFRMKCMIIWNFQHLKFGRLKEMFSKLFYILVHTPKMVHFDYIHTYAQQFDQINELRFQHNLGTNS